MSCSVNQGFLLLLPDLFFFDAHFVDCVSAEVADRAALPLVDFHLCLELVQAEGFDDVLEVDLTVELLLCEGNFLFELLLPFEPVPAAVVDMAFPVLAPAATARCKEAERDRVEVRLNQRFATLKNLFEKGSPFAIELIVFDILALEVERLQGVHIVMEFLVVPKHKAHDSDQGKSLRANYTNLAQ